MTGTVKINNMEFYAYHGHFPEEQVVGNWFRINTRIKTNFEKVALSDKLIDAVDYQLVYLIIKEEMAIPSKLLEPLANRILNKFFETFKDIEKAEIEIEKMNPPLGGKIESVSIILKKNRHKLKRRKNSRKINNTLPGLFEKSE